ncbi:MAG: hypothetical protein AAB444_00925 [Patescibacteria group bacterium]|mgnify:CR=1 FL=1
MGTSDTLAEMCKLREDVAGKRRFNQTHQHDQRPGARKQVTANEAAIKKDTKRYNALRKSLPFFHRWLTDPL